MPSCRANRSSFDFSSASLRQAPSLYPVLLFKVSHAVGVVPWDVHSSINNTQYKKHSHQHLRPLNYHSPESRLVICICLRSKKGHYGKRNSSTDWMAAIRLISGALARVIPLKGWYVPELPPFGLSFSKWVVGYLYQYSSSLKKLTSSDTFSALTCGSFPREFSLRDWCAPDLLHCGLLFIRWVVGSLAIL